MWYWFGLAALALIGEALSGTFYLLLVAVALVAAGIAAYFALAFGLQLAICAIVIVAGALVLRRVGVLKLRGDSTTNANVNLDIGQLVTVEAWESDGTARVWYRGAHWQAKLMQSAAAAAGATVAQTSTISSPQPGRYRIAGIRGSLLLLEPVNA